MGIFDEPLTDIKKNCLEMWDYSDIFPLTNYSFAKGPVITDGWPWTLLREMEQKVNQQASQPLISIMTLTMMDESIQFGDVERTGVGQGPLQYRLGRRASPSFLISCWADQQLGGMDFSRKLGGQVHLALFYYKNRLSTIRHLKVLSSREALEDNAQLYRFDLVVSGDVYQTLDV